MPALFSCWQIEIHTNLLFRTFLFAIFRKTSHSFPLGSLATWSLTHGLGQAVTYFSPSMFWNQIDLVSFIHRPSFPSSCSFGSFHWAANHRAFKITFWSTETVALSLPLFPPAPLVSSRSNPPPFLPLPTSIHPRGWHLVIFIHLFFPPTVTFSPGRNWSGVSFHRPDGCEYPRKGQKHSDWWGFAIGWGVRVFVCACVCVFWLQVGVSTRHLSPKPWRRCERMAVLIESRHESKVPLGKWTEKVLKDFFSFFG